MSELDSIMEVLESKKKDCDVFSKKHKNRGNEDLYQYYEGASWAIQFAIETVKERIE